LTSEYPERIVGIYTEIPRENHRSTQREPPVLTLEYPERTTGIDTGVAREKRRH
jgi:hypothetical protein